jgi:hypothetical protein
MRSNKQGVIYATRPEILEAFADLLTYWKEQEQTKYTKMAIAATEEILKGETK